MIVYPGSKAPMADIVTNIQFRRKPNFGWHMLLLLLSVSSSDCSGYLSLSCFPGYFHGFPFLNFKDYIRYRFATPFLIMITLCGYWQENVVVFVFHKKCIVLYP